MRKAIHLAWAVPLLAAPLALDAFAADPPAAAAGQPATAPPVISSHQIDRYQAITQLQDKLKSEPKSLADWVILGELGHEVALDLPADQAAKYNQMSLDAYQKALALDPDNPGLKAAVQFAQDQSSNSKMLDQSRTQATQTYLDARRRDLAATNYTPSVRVMAPPVPSRTLPQPAGAAVANQQQATAVVPPGTATIMTGAPVFSNYGYRPLYSSTTTTPYTFQQYSSAYYPPNYYGAGTNPISAQRYLQQSLKNAAGQPILRGVQPR